MYSGNYSMALRSLWNYCRDIIDGFGANDSTSDGKSFSSKYSRRNTRKTTTTLKCRRRRPTSTTASNILKGRSQFSAQINVFLRSLDLHLMNVK